MNGEADAAGSSGLADRTGPPTFDVSVANQARMYDYLFGGYFR